MSKSKKTKAKTTWHDDLEELYACGPAVAWARQFKTIAQAWKALPHAPDGVQWLEWIITALTGACVCYNGAALTVTPRGFVDCGLVDCWNGHIYSVADIIKEVPVPTRADLRAARKAHNSGSYPWETV